MENEDFEDGYRACLVDMREALAPMGIRLDIDDEGPVLRWYEVTGLDLVH